MSYASRVRGTASPRKAAIPGKFITSLLGLQVTMELVSGESFQGVLLQKSTADSYCLGQVQLQSKDDEAPNVNRFEDEVTFDVHQVACLKVHSESKGDRDEPSGGFKTDTEIGVRKGDKSMRSLKKWDGGDGDGTASISLDQEAKMRPEDRGWDQFKVNQKLFGYQSSYAEENYTTTLDRQSEFYRQNEPLARKVAAEIENEVSDNPHMAEERGHENIQGLDEESRFSTVLDRSESASSSNFYRPPALRGKSPDKTKTRASKPPVNSASLLSSKRSNSPPKDTSPMQDAQAASSVNHSPDKAKVSAQSASVKKISQPSPKPSSASETATVSKQSESQLDDPERKFQFNAGAKEFVPSVPMPGLYFPDGSYMPVIDPAAMAPMPTYPAYSFNPYVNPYAPMGYVNQPMMYPGPSGYPAYQNQQGQYPNRSRPQSRASKPSQPNGSEPNGDS